MMAGLKKRMESLWQSADAVMRGKAVEAIEYEIEELVNIFGTLVLGTFIGIPAPPVHVSMALLPLMSEELEVMLDRIMTAHDPLGDLFSVFSID